MVGSASDCAASDWCKYIGRCTYSGYQYSQCTSDNELVISLAGTVSAIASDSAGHSYVTGSFSKAFSLHGQSLTPKGSSSAFLLKLDKSVITTWLHQAEDEGWDIEVDSSGNTYLAGMFACNSSVTFGASVLVGKCSSSNQTSNIFVAKADSSGSFLWAVAITGGVIPFDAWGTTSSLLALDNSGSIFVRGHYDGPVVFGGKEYDDYPGSSAGHPFLAKVDANGQVLWMGPFAKTQPPIDAIASDGSSGVVLAGSDNNGSRTSYVARVDGNGNVTWTVALGKSADGWIFPRAVAVDRYKHIIVTGYYYGTASFGATKFTAQDADLFVAKLDANGKLLWAVSAGGPDTDDVRSVVVGNRGQIMIAGFFKGRAVFGDLFVGEPATGTTAFAAQLDSNGSFQWAVPAAFASKGRGIAIDVFGNALIAGYRDSGGFVWKISSVPVP
jgi:hypothetical protein